MMKNNLSEQTLTEIEALGLASKYDFANGHASHELTSMQKNIIEQLPTIWRRSAKQKSREAENMFKHAFQLLAKTPSITHYDYFKICPTASCSIDVTAAWLAEKKLKTALIEPTFDNLYLILKRRGVDLVALPETLLHSDNYTSILQNVDAVFLVNPNNPTGKIISQELFITIVNWCVENRKMIILDHSFRFFVPQLFDAYQILLDSGVTFIAIEDTGKVWPTQEIKASLLVCSATIFKQIDLIYDEIFLCHSNFALGILSEFLIDADRFGLHESVWKLVENRRHQFRQVLDNKILGIHAESWHSMISVEWIKIQSHFTCDIDVVNYFSAFNLMMLPGRQFYWNRGNQSERDSFVRVALLKPESEFLNGVAVLNKELKRLGDI